MDLLTGIPGQDVIRAQIEAVAENKNKLIFHFDIDCFVALNNVYGHGAGDEVLAYFGDKIKQFFGDVPHGRYGGEEFAVILDNTDESVQRASDFLMFISGNLTYNDDPITISGGVAPGKTTDPETGQKVLKADVLTHQAKNGDGPPTKSYYNWRRSRDDYLNYPSYYHPIYDTPLQERYNWLKDTSKGGLKENGKPYKFNRPTSSNLVRIGIQDIERLNTGSHISELNNQMVGLSDWENNFNEKIIKKFRDEAELDGHYKRESPKAYTTLDLRHPVTGILFDCCKAVSLIIEHAQKGGANSQCILGIMYMFGSGVNKDYKKSEYWLQKSVEQGLICAQAYLGECYYGWAVGLHPEEKREVFKQSIYWYERAAEQGNLWAQVNLAESYSEGLGVEEDQARAVYWLRKAAEQGDAGSQYGLGWHYNFGEGGDKNYELAAYWYEKSAAKGDHLAQYHLGLLYLHGHGVERSETKSKYWIKKSGKSSCSCTFCEMKAFLKYGKSIWDIKGE